MGSKLFPWTVAWGDFPDAHGGTCAEALNSSANRSTKLDQVIGDRLEAVYIAVERNRLKRFARFVEHSLRNLGGRRNRPGAI